MRKLLLLVLLATPLFAQVVQSGYVTYVTSAPSGSCSQNNRVRVVMGAGTVYTCQSGTWATVGGGGGSGTVNSALANQVAYYAADGTAVSGHTGFTFNGTSEVDLGVSAATQGTLGILGQNAAESFKLSSRIGVGVPVVYFTPLNSSVTSSQVLDIFPHGTAANFSTTTGAAWSDWCSNDVVTDSPNYECTRLGKFAAGGSTSSVAYLSSSCGGTGTCRNLVLQPFGTGGNVGIGTLTGVSSTLTVVATTTPAIELDTAPSTPKGYFAIATASNNYFTGAVANDIAYRGVGGNMLFGSNASTPVPTMTITAGTPGTVVDAGSFSAATYLTATNCAGVGTAASPSVVSCTAAPAGAFSCATNASAATCTVNTTAVTANSEIFVTEVADEGTRLSVTCNTAPTVTPAITVATKTAGSGFTINMPTITVNPACFDYHIVN